jgi:3alpha(or 20beta)-hydroxysteroid dehydrogenase
MTPIDTTDIYPTGTRLSGKVALITGGSRGLGESYARAMVVQGAKVVIADILDDVGQALVAELGKATRYIHLDVTSRDEWERAVAFTLNEFGALNVLINNAGVAHFSAIGEYQPEQWDSLIAINLTGVFNGVHASLAALKASAPSSVINISSIAGIRGYCGLVGYNAAKFGVTGLTKSVALDVAQYGIRCNSIHPGLFDTPMTTGVSPNRKHVAMERAGRPEELSSLVVYLASDEASFCTGAEFVCDGGETAGLAPNAFVE